MISNLESAPDMVSMLHVLATTTVDVFGSMVSVEDVTTDSGMAYSGDSVLYFFLSAFLVSIPLGGFRSGEWRAPFARQVERSLRAPTRDGGAGLSDDGDLGGRDSERIGGTHEAARRHAAVVDVVQEVDARAPRVDVVRVGQPDALPLLAAAHLGGKGWSEDRD